MVLMIKSYFISSSKHLANLEHILQKYSPDFVSFRDKECTDFKQKAKEFLAVAKKFFQGEIFLHHDFVLANELGFNGVHLSSKGFSEIIKAKELGLRVFISTHTKEEALLAKKLGADAITFSPIFHSPNKGEPKGVEALEELIKECDIKVFALGGIISVEQVANVSKSGAFGFASIRYFELD